MIISRKRLNAMIDEAVDKAREEMYTNERFNDIYRHMEETNRSFCQELTELKRELAELRATLKISK